MKKNEGGKNFEESIAKSCPQYMLVKKIASPASSWSGGKKSSFTSSNECDFIMHNDNTGVFYGLELKSTKLPSMTFWREDFAKDHPGTHFIIGKRQILGLQKWASTHKGVFGFILNFRQKNNATYFVPINTFVTYTSCMKKKCINIDDVKEMGGIEIKCRKLKVNYRYEMEDFFKIIEKTVQNY